MLYSMFVDKKNRCLVTESHGLTTWTSQTEPQPLQMAPYCPSLQKPPGSNVGHWAQRTGESAQWGWMRRKVRKDGL